MRFFVYQVTNNINQKVYVGAHQTENINDDYMGSGRVIQQAVKKYGKENFTRVILCECSSAKEMYHEEAKWVTKEFIARADTYNIGVGGQGGALHTQPHTLESRLKMRHPKRDASKMGQYERTQNVREKISQNRKGKGLGNINRVGKTFTEESRQRISVSLKAFYAGQ